MALSSFLGSGNPKSFQLPPSNGLGARFGGVLQPPVKEATAIKIKQKGRMAFIIGERLDRGSEWIVPGNAFDRLRPAIGLIVDEDVLPPGPTVWYGNPDGVPTRSIFQEFNLRWLLFLN